MEISYSQCGDYLIPDLILPEAEQKPIGKYGRMRKHYLKDHRPVLYSNLLLSGKLQQGVQANPLNGLAALLQAAPAPAQDNTAVEDDLDTAMDFINSL